MNELHERRNILRNAHAESGCYIISLADAYCVLLSDFVSGRGVGISRPSRLGSHLHQGHGYSSRTGLLHSHWTTGRVTGQSVSHVSPPKLETVGSFRRRNPWNILAELFNCQTHKHIFCVWQYYCMVARWELQFQFLVVVFSPRSLPFILLIKSFDQIFWFWN